MSSQPVVLERWLSEPGLSVRSGWHGLGGHLSRCPYSSDGALEVALEQRRGICHHVLVLRLALDGFAGMLRGEDAAQNPLRFRVDERAQVSIPRRTVLAP